MVADLQRLYSFARRANEIEGEIATKLVAISAQEAPVSTAAKPPVGVSLDGPEAMVTTQDELPPGQCGDDPLEHQQQNSQTLSLSDDIDPRVESFFEIATLYETINQYSNADAYYRKALGCFDPLLAPTLYRELLRAHAKVCKLTKNYSVARDQLLR